MFKIYIFVLMFGTKPTSALHYTHAHKKKFRKNVTIAIFHNKHKKFI